MQDGSEVKFRGWYTNSFVAADGVTPVEGGNGQSGFFYQYDCTINDDGNVVIPAIEIQPTTESNPTAGFFGALFVNGSPTQMIIGTPQATAGWQIPTIYGSTMNFGQLALYNAAVQILFASNSFFTQNQTILEIQLLAGQFLYAAVGINGIGQPSIAPDVASEPIFWGVNDPAVGDLHGTLTENAVPRASAEKVLADGLAVDNGTDFSIQTLNNFQAGDYQVQQNGSCVSVNDTFGRANLFAGADSANEYAGVSCACDSGTGQVYIQSTDITHLYGSERRTILGDAQDNGNSTKIEINDILQQIKFFNLPTVEPADPNVLWRDGDFLKITS